MFESHTNPVVGITMGDPAGIGPEIIVKAWPQLTRDLQFRFCVIGHAIHLQRAADQLDVRIDAVDIADANLQHDCLADATQLNCLPGGDSGARLFEFGRVEPAAGRAAAEYIERAIDLAKQGTIDAIVTAPINKAALTAGGYDFPGHTEIFGERFGVDEFAMMLHVPEGNRIGGEIGLGVVHTTLHQSLRSAIEELSAANIVSKCKLAHEFACDALQFRQIDRAPRIAVAALNPHAGEQGLFGREEIDIIRPAVETAQELGINCTGPLPCDTLMSRAAAGEFDMVVAMYHDQGHIALKLLGMHQAVNVTLGLPIVRTSVAHGTAFEIAGMGQADHRSLLRAADVAKWMALHRQNRLAKSNA